MLQRPTHPPRSASHALPSPNQLVARAWLAEAPPGVVVTVAASAIACIGLAVALAAAAAARRVAALDGSTARYAAAGARRASPLTRARRSAREHARGDACTALALLWLGLLLAPLPVSRLVLRACCAAFCRAAALFAPPPALRRPRSPPCSRVLPSPRRDGRQNSQELLLRPPHPRRVWPSASPVSLRGAGSSAASATRGAVESATVESVKTGNAAGVGPNRTRPSRHAFHLRRSARPATAWSRCAPCCGRALCQATAAATAVRATKRMRRAMRARPSFPSSAPRRRSRASPA